MNFKIDIKDFLSYKVINIYYNPGSIKIKVKKAKYFLFINY